MHLKVSLQIQGELRSASCELKTTSLDVRVENCELHIENCAKLRITAEKLRHGTRGFSNNASVIIT